MSGTEEKKMGTYFSVIDGTFRRPAQPGDTDTVIRQWKTPDGKSGEKEEKVFNALFGKIEDIEFRDGDYGKNLNITLDPDEDGNSPVISVGASSRYGEDILKKLPNIRLNEEVRLRPFSFKGDEDKEVRGVEITHKDSEGKFTKKVLNFFWDAEKKETKNGYPIPDEEDKQDWPFFYKKANKFLVKYTEEKILPTFAEKTLAPVEYPADDSIDPSSIPFN